jgi:TRAP-type C4-dicarboxylate transport system permease large subunit
MHEIFKGCFWFLLFEFASLALLFAFPWISTVLPYSMYGR